MLERLVSLQLRSLVRLLDRLQCTREAVCRRRWLRRGRPLVRQVDLWRLRVRQWLRRSRRRTLGIVDTTMVWRMWVRRVWLVVALWPTMRRVWVLLLRHRVVHRVMLVRRLAGRHCEEGRARWMLRRRLVWLLERL